MSVSASPLRRNLNVKIAYPGVLGKGLPTPPEGFIPTNAGFTAMNPRTLQSLNWDGTEWIDPTTGEPFA